jgi:hypothetical protein
LLLTRLAAARLPGLTKRLSYSAVRELGEFVRALLYQLPLPLVMLGWDAQHWEAAYVWYRALLIWAFAAVYAYTYGRSLRDGDVGK